MLQNSFGNVVSYFEVKLYMVNVYFSAYGKLKKSCSLFWSQSTTRVNNNPQKLSFIANKRQSKLKSAEHHAGTDSVSLVDKTECMMNDNGVNVVGEVDADKCEVDRGSEQYRYLFVLYGPLSAFMAASASVAILMCSCAVRKDQVICFLPKTKSRHLGCVKVFTVNERSEDSFIGRDDIVFFLRQIRLFAF